MLEVQAIRKKYRSTQALKEISLSLPQGGIGVLLGPNGAGKTTLLKVIANLVLPDAGKVFFQKKNVHENPTRAFPGISLMAGEEKSFYWRLTGRQNLEFFAALYGIPRHTWERRISDLAHLLEFDDLGKMYQEYSTGFRQRLAMMRSLLTESQLILMDEPTRSLDPLAADHFRKLILDQLKATGKTILLSTHHLEEARLLGDQIFVMSGGYLRAHFRREDIQSGVQLASLYQSHVVPNAF